MIHSVTNLGDTVLDMPLETITEFSCNPAMLVKDMFETMYAAHGIGLAAPQIGLSSRVVVIDLSFNEDPGAKIVLVNPMIVCAEGYQTSQKGGLSIPGVHKIVTRPRTVSLRAPDADGNWFERTSYGLLARAVLHETDHLDGILSLSRISGLKRGLIKRQVNKLIDAGRW
jgi:peptide deformylase